MSAKSLGWRQSQEKSDLRFVYIPLVPAVEIGPQLLIGEWLGRWLCGGWHGVWAILGW
jgi:hypothetical protein